MLGEQVKSGEFTTNEGEQVEVYKEERLDDKTREIVVPKTGKWGGKEGAEKLRKMIDDAKQKRSL